MNSPVSDTERQRERIEVYNTILLAIATMAVAWSSYQGSLWNGIQTFRLAESNKYGRLAQQKLIQSEQNKAMEEAVIIEFFNAAFDKNERKIKYILRGLRPEMANVLSNWMQSHPFENDTAPSHPMIMPEYEALMKNRIDESEKMNAKGAEMYQQAQKANIRADRYSFLTVLFSSVMFLGAITTKLVRPKPRFVLSVLSALICLGGLILLFFYMPVAHK